MILLEAALGEVRDECVIKILEEPIIPVKRKKDEICSHQRRDHHKIANPH